MLAQLGELCAEHGARFGLVGGSGTLLASPDGPRQDETDDYPEAFVESSRLQGRVLDALRASDERLDWFSVTPAADYGRWNPGERTGHYRVGGDVLLRDENGISDISGADLAIAIADEIETPRHHRQRFSVAY